MPEKRLLAGMACGEFGTRALLMVEWPLFSNKAPILAPNSRIVVYVHIVINVANIDFFLEELIDFI